MSKIITVDGTASSGKSTAGFLFAQKIGYQFIDSGLIYRVGTYLAKKNNIPASDASQCAELLAKSNIEFKTQKFKVMVYLNNEDVTDLLKTPEIDKEVPIVAAHRQVREATKDIQRKVGLQQNTVMAGRDIGSEIFPEAHLKFFITASLEARAKRRFDQMIKSYPDIKYEAIEQDIKKRDEMDSDREVSPMRIPQDAFIIDTSNMTIDEVVDKLMIHFRTY